jgi:hypothetical protein
MMRHPHAAVVYPAHVPAVPHPVGLVVDYPAGLRVGVAPAVLYRAARRLVGVLVAVVFPAVRVKDRPLADVPAAVMKP